MWSQRVQEGRRALFSCFYPAVFSWNKEEMAAGPTPPPKSHWTSLLVRPPVVPVRPCTCTVPLIHVMSFPAYPGMWPDRLCGCWYLHCPALCLLVHALSVPALSRAVSHGTCTVSTCTVPPCVSWHMHCPAPWLLVHTIPRPMSLASCTVPPCAGNACQSGPLCLRHALPHSVYPGTCTASSWVSWNTHCPILCLLGHALSRLVSPGTRTAPSCVSWNTHNPALGLLGHERPRPGSHGTCSVPPCVSWDMHCRAQSLLVPYVVGQSLCLLGHALSCFMCRATSIVLPSASVPACACAHVVLHMCRAVPLCLRACVAAGMFPAVSHGPTCSAGRPGAKRRPSGADPRGTRGSVRGPARGCTAERRRAVGPGP
jgi:hypothetical protein